MTCVVVSRSEKLIVEFATDVFVNKLSNNQVSYKLRCP